MVFKIKMSCLKYTYKFYKLYKLYKLYKDIIYKYKICLLN